MIDMPAALTILGLCAVVIAAIIKRPPQPLMKHSETTVNSATCSTCKAELTRRIDERSGETQSIFRELKKQGKQLARIEERLHISPPPGEE